MRFVYIPAFIVAIAVLAVACSDSSSSSGSSSSSSSSSSSGSAGQPDGDIRVNQIGYYPDGPKVAVVPDVNVNAFAVVSADDGSEQFSGTLSAAQTWVHSEETVRLADFSAVTAPGEYQVRVEGLDDSHVFTVGGDVHREVNTGSLKAYYYNRAGTALEEPYAGQWSRAAGHPDTDVLIHESAESAVRPTGTSIESPKGWYDAGDYNKYIVNSGISTYTLLAAYEHFSTYYDSLQTNIPESGQSMNDMPDILDEAKWNIDWMLSMQEPVAEGGDGGVYHKLTTQNFAGFVMPEEATAQRYVVQKTTAAALNFAAVMAVAARIYDTYDQAFADQCRDAAVDALAWADDNDNIPYQQPSDINTGEYAQQSGQYADEFAWANAELFITTGDDAYYTAFDSYNVGANIPWWGGSAGLAWMSLAHHRNSLGLTNDQVNTIENEIIGLTDDLVAEFQSSAYGMPMGESESDFVWGSNSVALNQAMMLIQAYRIDQTNADYRNAALANLDYVLGRNATGYSFVTGFGDMTPQNIHHRQSGADGIAEPVPGFIAGGPNPGQQDSDNCPAYPSDAPARSYLDEQCSYASNEITINWNAPLVYVSGAMEVLMQP